jgi:hypothetical protein
MTIWQLPEPLPSSAHACKYGLAYVVAEVSVLRYDNEAGKGDHKHLASQGNPHRFNDLAALLVGFSLDVDHWRNSHDHPSN